MTVLEKKVDALCRLTCARDDSEFNSVMEELRSLMEKPQVEIHVPITMKDRIRNVLTQLGVNHGILGRKYLEDAIELAINQPDVLKRMTGPGGIYQLVADRNGTTGNKAERAIRHGIENGWTRSDPEDLQKVFGGTVHPDKGKPTNREYIATVAQYLQMEV